MSGWSVLPAAAQADSTAAAKVPAVHGTVRDAAGKPVVGATVRLERQGESGAMETKTAGDGAFAFLSAAAGKYVVRAQKDSLRSSGVEVTIQSPEDETRGSGSQTIVLKLESAGTGSNSDLGTQPMEFSDSPSFTIASVTDWTAAGGHGSDAILRTSESLTRDAVHLKDPNAGTDATANAALKQKESALRVALANAPGSFEANRDLGKLYLEEGRYREAISLFEAAHRVNPDDDANEYDWARALQEAGKFGEARRHIGDLLGKRKTADTLRFAGELDEKLGDPVAAVNEFEQAVHEDGSEENYFEWGSELLLHRAIWQAKDVFTAGAKRYPTSARMLTALGAALFASSLYDDAARRLCEAADLSPASEEPYIFLGKADMASPNPLRCTEEKLADFVKRHPENPLASYYDAMAIWKQNGRSTNPQILEQVESLLNRAVALDPRCSDAYLQLGNLNSARHDNAKAIAEYTKAIEANPQLAEAHYRLGMAYDRIGDRDKAKREFQLHEELDKQQAAEVERQRREVKQFLVKGSSVETSNP